MSTQQQQRKFSIEDESTFLHTQSKSIITYIINHKLSTKDEKLYKKVAKMFKKLQSQYLMIENIVHTIDSMERLDELYGVLHDEKEKKSINEKLKKLYVSKLKHIKAYLKTKKEFLKL